MRAAIFAIQTIMKSTLSAILRRHSASALLLLLPLHLHGQATTARPGTARTAARTTAQRTAAGAGQSSNAAGPRQYRSNTVLGDAVIQVDPETRSLVIVADEETHGEIMKIITELDRPKPQVLIKVVFMEVTYNNSLDVGVEGSYTFNVGSGLSTVDPNTTRNQTVVTNATDAAGNTTTTTTTTGGPLSTAAAAGIGTAASAFGLAQLTNGTFVRVATDDWQATLRALSLKGKLEVLSRPSILARNNQEAVIVVGQEVPFITNSRITSDGQTINTVSYEDVGIILRVTPFITSEGTVEMIVAPEISTVTDQTVPISDTINSPIIAKRSAETVVVTPNATTVVIGGLMETQSTEAIQKVPLLGDIPILGFPFRRTVKSDVKRELLIFLTPYIVNTPETLRQITLDEANRTELAADAFSASDIEKHIDTLRLLPPMRSSTTLRAVEGDEDVTEIRRASPVQVQRLSVPGKR